jgi:hypothetical protein
MGCQCMARGLQSASWEEIGEGRWEVEELFRPHHHAVRLCIDQVDTL